MTTVTCKLQQCDRYRVPQNVFLLSVQCNLGPYALHKNTTYLLTSIPICDSILCIKGNLTWRIEKGKINQEHLLFLVLASKVLDSTVDDAPRYLATTLNSYREFASRPVTVCCKPVDSVVDFQKLLPTLRYFMMYTTTLEELAPSRGLYDNFTLEHVTESILGRWITPSVSTQHSKQRLRNTLGCAK